MIQKNKQSEKDREIARLKHELKRSHQIIERLKSQNFKFHNIISSYETNQSKEFRDLELEEDSLGKKTNLGFHILNYIRSRSLEIFVALLLVFIIVLFFRKNSNLPIHQTSQSPNKPLNTPNTPLPNSTPSTLVLPSPPIDELSYQVTPSIFQKDERLQKIVDSVIQLSKKNGLSTQNLSISIIDMNSLETAGYQADKLRYPASVVKLFLLVALYGQFHADKWPDQSIFYDDISKMMRRSDNEATSRIIDKLTNTTSGDKLNSEEYKKWANKRYSLSRFFQRSGYENINISQKTFPIPSEKLYTPQGRDLQIRGDLNNPIRNKISTQQAARLMYEIVTNKAVSPEYGKGILQWLVRDLNSEIWKKINPSTDYFNPVRSFFGESLPKNIFFASKAGWTNNSRQEVAYIRSSDQKTNFILAIFTEDPIYAKNKNIFPKMSLHVFNMMTR